jgi:flagellar basal body-associated protein FliL
MLKNRKSQGLPIQVIIIAVIGLFVLAVSLYIFSTQSGKAASSLESCYTRGGECGDV